MTQQVGPSDRPMGPFQVIPVVVYDGLKKEAEVVLFVHVLRTLQHGKGIVGLLHLMQGKRF